MHSRKRTVRFPRWIVCSISRSRRLAAITDTLLPQLGDRVVAGPFAGMTYPPDSAEGYFVPKLLGCYEQELHPALAQFCQGRPGTVLNIGCAEGYYAVGLARALPNVTIYAWDIAPNAREKTARMPRRTALVTKSSLRLTSTRGAGDLPTAFLLLSATSRVLSSNIWIPPGFPRFRRST